MRYPRAVLTFDAGLETFTAEFLNQRRREQRWHDRETFVRPERIDRLADFRKWFNAICKDWPYVGSFEFTVHNELLFQFVQTKSTISFRKKKISGSIIAKKIRREHVNVAEPKPTPAISAEGGARLKEGGEMPPLSLTNQNGERISLNTFRSKPFVLTFVFTRCPVPNFCPRMANNFEELQMAIKTGSGALAKTLLPSITLDLGFDTPQVLSAYAASHQTDPKVWTFATDHEQEIDALTRAFSVYRQTEGGTISQGSLRR
jgi:cytochrome oxidase Cu insertion factor (SCO1/SenC/PrrC family)